MQENAHDQCNAMKCHKYECPGLPWSAELFKTLGLQLQSFHLLEIIKNSKEKCQTTLFNVPEILWVREKCETWWQNRALKCGPNAKRII
jgi:hypothetical protein